MRAWEVTVGRQASAKGSGGGVTQPQSDHQSQAIRAQTARWADSRAGLHRALT